MVAVTLHIGHPDDERYVRYPGAFTEVLSALQALVGEHVFVGITAPDLAKRPGREWAAFAGYLQGGVPDKPDPDELSFLVSTDEGGELVAGSVQIAESEICRLRATDGGAVVILAVGRTITVAATSGIEPSQEGDA
jgi:hypothetical protein